MSNSFDLCSTHFSRGAKNFAEGFLVAGYGLEHMFEEQSTKRQFKRWQILDLLNKYKQFLINFAREKRSQFYVF